MTEPIKPSEATKTLPEFVIVAVNTIIQEKLKGSEAKFTQNELIGKIIIYGGGNINREVIFDKGYLDVEDTFRAVGWKVFYDKPAYNETYEPTFTFRK